LKGSYGYKQDLNYYFMFIPKTFEFNDFAAKIAFMKQYSFATIITTKDQVPLATHLPFFVADSSEKLVLRAHFAIANEQAKYVEHQTSLVIFSEPHAYISPTHYDRQESVPTWNYLAVHAYGTAKILDTEAAKAELLEQMINSYEPAYMEQWNSLSEKFKTGMMRGIVAFELEVTDLQGQQKLSQNKSDTERERIIQQLEKSSDSVENTLAGYMRKTQ
jgi:transcriptional regulator